MDFYKSTTLSPELNKYYQAITRIVDNVSVPQGETKLLDHLYLGSLDEAEDVNKLQNLGITHVINTVHNQTAPTTRHVYGGTFEYLGFTSVDDKRYDIMHHFTSVFEFIERARKWGGKCFIHCLAGINRSGVLATAYVMIHKDCGPITAVKYVHEKRGILLSNHGFIEALILLAYERGMLEKDKDII